ncbi:MAG: NAD-dependent epimerase/dehydratase family protein [Acetobacterium woodii]|nr:NAD-dependent epimerase/dehydratase family protein [Acetobacterium woodii]MBI5677188.1 NAD-dependent epimerase/dehydratase family protein [Planctomycetota bacterium]
MRILITGVAGFIGSNLADRLLQEGHEVVGLDNLTYGLKENIPEDVNFYQIDIRDRSIYSIFEGVDAVFHLAAKNCIADCQDDPVETADINVHGTVNVFEAARKLKVKKIIYAESSAIYEGSKLYPTPESEIKPESFYATSKLSSMYFAEAYRKFYKLKFTALRYFCVYGPVQDYRRTIPPVMSAFIIKLLMDEHAIIYGTGKKRRDFVYVDDINDFHLLCLNDERTDNRVFNLGSGVNYSINEIYKLVSELLGIHNPPIYKPELSGEAEETLADIHEAESLGWRPKTAIRTGIMRSIDYIKSEMAKGHI